MEYTKKSFSVGATPGKRYRDNWDRIFRHGAESEEEAKAEEDASEALKDVRDEASAIVTDLVNREIATKSVEGKRLEELITVEQAIMQNPEGEA